MQILAINQNEEHKLAQRSFSLFDRRTLSALMLMGLVHCTSAAEEPLPPDQAFRLKASLKGSDTVVAEIIPAKKHYLYKNKVRFALKNASGATPWRLSKRNVTAFGGSSATLSKPRDCHQMIQLNPSTEKRPASILPGSMTSAAPTVPTKIVKS